jgi:hypothetical protein
MVLTQLPVHLVQKFMTKGVVAQAPATADLLACLKVAFLMVTQACLSKRSTRMHWIHKGVVELPLNFSAGAGFDDLFGQNANPKPI